MRLRLFLIGWRIFLSPLLELDLPSRGLYSSRLQCTVVSCLFATCTCSEQGCAPGRRSLDDRAYVDTLFGHQSEVGSAPLVSGSVPRSMAVQALLSSRPSTLLGSTQGQAPGDWCFPQVLAVDALRAERVLTSGQDHTCRVWKVPEESQLIFRCAPKRFTSH